MRQQHMTWLPAFQGLDSRDLHGRLQVKIKIRAYQKFLKQDVSKRVVYSHYLLRFSAEDFIASLLSC